jgi:hypothetical protein
MLGGLASTMRRPDVPDPGDPVPGRVPVAAVGDGPAQVAGTVRRLVFEPDGGDGRLIATLEDATGELVALLARPHARDWAPGAAVAAEGTMQSGVFVVRAYQSVSETAAGPWTEVAPLSAPVA